MTSWGVFILVAALFLGLRRPTDARHRYAAGVVVVLIAVLYAALRQHTF
jgi:hypothetical protein